METKTLRKEIRETLRKLGVRVPEDNFDSVGVDNAIYSVNEIIKNFLTELVDDLWNIEFDESEDKDITRTIIMKQIETRSGWKIEELQNKEDGK